jgi:hypothetical protein
MEKTDAPEDMEAWSWMSVADESDSSPNGSKETMLAVSMSELERMSTSDMISAQDIVRWEGAETRGRVVMGVQTGESVRHISILSGRGTGGWYTSPPITAKPQHRWLSGGNINKNKYRQPDFTGFPTLWSSSQARGSGGREKDSSYYSGVRITSFPPHNTRIR